MVLFRRRVNFVVRTVLQQKTVFGLGICIGITLAILFEFVSDPDNLLSHVHLVGLASVPFAKLDIQKTLSYYDATYNYAYENWLAQSFDGAFSVLMNPDDRRYSADAVEMSPEVIQQISDKPHFNFPEEIKKFVEEKQNFDPRNEAFFLYNEIRVVCVVFPTDPEWARAVRETWGKHCNELQMFSSKIKNSSLGIQLIAAASEFSLFCQGFQFIESKNKMKNFWVLVATQDTFVLVENLRFYVAPFNQSGEFYLGHAMTFWNSVYNWYDAGFVMSSGALTRLIREKFPDRAACEAGGKYWKNGDWYLGKHLHEIGISPLDTRDHAGRGRFNGFSLKKLLFPGGVSLFERYWRDSLYLSQDGPHCCSNYAITFHGIVSKSKMYQLEYLLHHLVPFHRGGRRGNLPAPPSRRDSKSSYLTWEERLKDEALAKMFDSPSLMTTPKNMDALMRGGI